MCEITKGFSSQCAATVSLQKVKLLFDPETKEVYDASGKYLGQGIAILNDKGEVHSIELTIE